MKIDQLLTVIACPVCHGKLASVAEALLCEACHIQYEIKDGIPILIPPETAKAQV